MATSPTRARLAHRSTTDKGHPNLLALALTAAKVALAGIAALVVILAQEGPTGIVTTYWPVVAALVPIVTALATKVGAAKWVKLGVCGALALAAAVVTGAGFDWSTITPDDLITRSFAIFGAAQVAYHAAESLFKRRFGTGFNELAVFAPDRGIG